MNILRWASRMAHQAVRPNPSLRRPQWNEDPNVLIGLLCTLGFTGMVLFARVHVVWGLLVLPSAAFALWVSANQRRGRHER